MCDLSIVVRHLPILQLDWEQEHNCQYQSTEWIDFSPHYNIVGNSGPLISLSNIFWSYGSSISPLKLPCLFLFPVLQLIVLYESSQ